MKTNPLFGLFDEVVGAVVNAPPRKPTRIAKVKFVKHEKPSDGTDVRSPPQLQEKDRSSK